MKLRNLSNDDLWLYEAIHCDPAMMEHVGGPLPREGLAEKLVRDVASVEADTSWILAIVPDEDPSTAAGTVAVWEHVMETETVNEIGWMVLPAFQGRGLGSEAVRTVLEAGARRRPVEPASCLPSGRQRPIERDVPQDGIHVDPEIGLPVPRPNPAVQ